VITNTPAITEHYYTTKSHHPAAIYRKAQKLIKPASCNHSFLFL